MIFSRLQPGAERLVSSLLFQRFVVGAILFSALLLGLETSESLRQEYFGLFHFLDRLVLGVFVAEIALKIVATGHRPLDYFRDGWNVLDFLIVLGCLVPAGSNALAVFRLVRVLRILRLITAFPQLRIIVTALLKSIPSMGSVSLLLFIHFYTYAVLGVFLFGKNDPLHFGNIGVSFLSLFTTLTLEGWVDLMKAQMHGDLGQPVAAVAYFISFIVFGTMIILNLLIGVVVGSMTDAKEQSREGLSTEEKTYRLLLEIKEKIDRRP